MIVFDKLFKTMKTMGVSQYDLIKKYGISTGQLDRVRKNKNITTHTLDMLCSILGCKLEEIAKFKKKNK